MNRLEPVTGVQAGGNMGIFTEILNKTGSLFPTKKTEKPRDRSEYWKKRHKSRQNNSWYYRNKEKNKDNVLKYKYGITLEEYNLMVESQNGLCALCDKHNVKIRGETISLAVDHDHETGKIRGLLCNACNTSLGVYKTIAMLKKVIKYLEKADEVLDSNR